jgi:hypothetical protein
VGLGAPVLFVSGFVDHFFLGHSQMAVSEALGFLRLPEVVA